MKESNEVSYVTLDLHIRKPEYFLFKSEALVAMQLCYKVNSK